jgi:integrase|tara:strand:- start:1726 stop:3249 length:1524 start_codon:yes stop_codon:yes gene_type:complete
MALFNIWIFQESPSRLKAPQAASGLYPVKVNISSDLDRTAEGNRKRKMINTGVACSPEVFKAMYPTLGDTVTAKMKKIAATAEAVEMKKSIEEVKNRYYNIVKDLTIDNNPQKIYTIDQLMHAARAARAAKLPFDKAVTTLEYHFNKYIADNGEFLSKNSISRMRSALNSFAIFHLLPKQFKNKEEKRKAVIALSERYQTVKKDGITMAKLTVYDIDKLFLTQWQKFMRDGNNFKDGKPRTLKTINGYVKNLTSVLNEVINNDMIAYSKDMMPIGSNKKKQYQNPAPLKNEAKIIRFLNEEDLQKLKNYDPETPQEEKAKDVWLLSYYLGGCNCVDLVNFRKSNIQEEHDTLQWYRNKNKSKQSQTVSRVPLTAEAKELIKKYEPVENLYTESNGYIVDRKPEISGVEWSSFLLNFHQFSKNDENTASNLRTLVNKGNHLKAIGKKTKMKHPLTFEMARHTCFSNLQRTGSTFAEIMEISGHSRTDTLRNYLNNLKPADMRKAVEKL